MLYRYCNNIALTAEKQSLYRTDKKRCIMCSNDFPKLTTGHTIGHNDRLSQIQFSSDDKTPYDFSKYNMIFYSIKSN